MRIILCGLIALILTSQVARGEDAGSEAKAVPSLPVSRDMERQLSEALKTRSEDKIVSAASQILGRNPNHLYALNSLAVLYYTQKKYSMAKLILKRAEKEHPQEPVIQNNLGVIALAEGDMRLALEIFKKIASAKNYSRGAANLSSILVGYGDYQGARAPLADAYKEVRSEIKGGNQVAMAVANNYAVALMGVGEGSESRRVFETLVESGVRSPEVHLNYAILLVEVLDKKNDAQKILSKIQFMTEDKKILNKVLELEKRAK
jgi:Flp pilus assembly protein TadD